MNVVSFVLFFICLCFLVYYIFILVFSLYQRSKKTRLVALIILAPVISKTDLTTSSYEGCKVYFVLFCFCLCFLVAYIILVFSLYQRTQSLRVSKQLNHAMSLTIL